MHRTGELFGQFETMDQQRESSSLGMWVFLVTEVLFFGGMFMTYTLNRSTYPGIFAEASRSIRLSLGAINTVVLIGSSRSDRATGALASTGIALSRTGPAARSRLNRCATTPAP